MCAGRSGWCDSRSTGLLHLPLSGTRARNRRSETTVTYNKDIAPLLWDHCKLSPREQLAPFSLMTYDEVRPTPRILQVRAAPYAVKPDRVTADSAAGGCRNKSA